MAHRRRIRWPADHAQRRGGLLTIAGPDGTGKSTLCAALTDAGLGSYPLRRMHHRFEVRPRRRHQDIDVTRPHAQRPYPTPLSWLKTVYVFFDYLLGWQLHGRPFVANGGWIVLERGWWDMAVDQRRYRMQRSGGLIKALGWLLPCPDLVIVLVARVDQVTKRKAELAAAELERQFAAWRHVLPRRARRHYLDAGAPASEVVRELLVVVRGLIEERNGVLPC